MEISSDPIDENIGFLYEAAGRQMKEHLITEG
jgi:hypothetical protein